MTWFRFLILSLSTFRIALMVSKEDGPWKIFTKLRSFVKRKSSKGSNLNKGIECIWCVSVWFGVLVSITNLFFEGNIIYEILILSLSLSAVAIIINQSFTRN